MKTVKVILYNIVVLAVLLILVELFFGSWIFSTNKLNNLGILRNTNLEYEHNLYGESGGVVKYTRDEFGFRGSTIFGRPEIIDILTIGGSTTDQRYITDSLTWQEHMQRALKEKGIQVNIANAGVDGQSTFGHIKNFELWFPEVEGLQPDIVLFYAGVNDFFKTSDESKYDIVEAGIGTYIKNNSAIYNLFRKIGGAMKAKRVKVEHQALDFGNYDWTRDRIEDEAFVNAFTNNNLPAFSKRVERLVEWCENIGARPVFVTQPSSQYRFEGDTLYGVGEVFELEEGYRYNGVDYYQMISQLNNEIMKACNSGCQVIELTSLPIWTTSDFYDWYHNTPAGAEKVGKIIAGQIKLD